ncbi:MAG: LysR family transcriptional regulator [Solobacterium sp.]|nr:LysR family transcriptional regulator [Solobacterium sp.]
MNYNHLVYFQALAGLENYRKAAQQLHITQPSLSNAIHNMEEDLGVQLFEKKGRGIRLTAQGIKFLEYVNRAMKELNEGELMLSYELASSDHFLRLGYVMSVTNDVIPEWLAGFRRQYRKNVFFSCINDTSDALVNELLNGNVDLIFCADMKDPRIIQTPLFRRDPVLLTPKDHRLANRKSVDISELTGEPFIAHSRKTSFHRIMAEVYLRSGTHVRIVSEADEDRAIIGMVRKGLGCGVVLESPEIHGEGFSAIPITGTGFQGELCIGRRANDTLPDAAEAFCRYVLENKEGIQQSEHS